MVVSKIMQKIFLGIKHKNVCSKFLCKSICNVGKMCYTLKVEFFENKFRKAWLLYGKNG